MNTRQQILAATERIIRARGIARVTTKEIAREAGCAEGTLYKHFEGKEELFLTVLQQHLPSFLESLGEIEAGQGTVSANLERIALAAMNYYERLFPVASAMFADTDLLMHHRAVIRRVNGGPHSLCARVAAYIEAEQRLGRLHSELNPLNGAEALLGACFQQAFFRQFMGEDYQTVSNEVFVAGHVQTLLLGLGPASK